jgi:hypothetical protein
MTAHSLRAAYHLAYLGAVSLSATLLLATGLAVLVGVGRAG